MAAMAVEDESLHHATKHLILEKPQKYYSTLVHDRSSGNHWQLRSLLSSPNRNIIYYPSGYNVCALNTKTRERSIVATLAFSPQCLVASKEWICCGGEKGDPNYAAICLSGRGTLPSFLDQHADPDARLPLDLDPSRRFTFVRELDINVGRVRDDIRPPIIKYLRLGKEIINSITLWEPKEGGTSPHAYNLPVAVVSINDCSVRILNLHNSEVLEKLELPDCVNRSVISPDGELLVNVCDDPFLYVHERRPKLDENQATCSSSQSYEWVLACKTQLEGQKLSDRSIWRGSFTACFSNSQKYLAVATQYGIISVFCIEKGTGFGSVLATFTTSRPTDENGAVRAMEFSPGPFDLLAWTESSGRVGVADVRNLFLSRQLLLLDPNANGVERVIVVDSPSEAFLDPRLRSYHTNSPTSNTPDYLSMDSERRLLRLMDSHHASGELEVLAAHRDARRRRDAANGAAAEASAPSRWSALDTWSVGQQAPSSMSTNEERNRSNERRIPAAGLPASLRDFVNGDRSQASIRSFINERNRETERRNQQQHEPRRRGSMILAAVQNEIERHERESLGPGTSRSGNDNASSLERLTLSQSRAPADWTSETDTVYGSGFAADPPVERSARLRIEFEDNGRDFAHRLRQPWRPTDEMSHFEVVRNRGTLSNRRLDPLATNGCCWSEDGSILYAAIEDGIFEFHVNIMGRKKFPSLVLR